MHIAQGVMKALNNKADWFAQLNNKMGGDLTQIQTVGKYMVEVWKAVGMDLSKVEFLSSSEEINKRPEEYWTLVMDIVRKNSLKRIVRCSQIMGRSEADDLTAAQIFYPCMQCADIFFLKADICQLGMGQRKVNMLAREYCDSKRKPIVLSHKMMPGLLEGQEKMSKSDPNSAIFMEDSEAEVTTGNPCFEYARFIVLPWVGHFDVLRPADHGGDKRYVSVVELAADYEEGALHPGDLKAGLSRHLNAILQPVRDHFENSEEAMELLKKVKSYKVTK
ncbi:Tyrosine--tRNA ligase [Tetrabaena socialis]|uniref:tyrosine--tRNA ligase n=1 Tax=Tetrabaena socialis TaxID=47790 RepID=A0A2J8A750_9CHLO|nr:Tyrosine--tRNA ligase [Tetrabaena socialis]|eukprot:PNH08354.1 Tyrosine--tRNA ligase [Tetrabaena socialis]